MFGLPFRRSRRKASAASATTRIEVASRLQYTVRTRTAFLLRIEAADNAHQDIVEESFETEPALTLERAARGPSGNRLVRLVAEPGPLVVRYRAIVGLAPEVKAPAGLDEGDFSKLPVGTLVYLNPSRYCESDRLAALAWTEFGTLAPGYGRVSAVVDWVHDRLSYVPGSTGPSTTACDVIDSRRGVCRDYAHVTIALCRALGIPARYVSGYAVDLQPPDFHGFCEVWLGRGWYLFDATRLAPLSGLVRIGTGRDAADVSFATIVGSADSYAPLVSAMRVGGEGVAGEGAAGEGVPAGTAGVSERAIGTD